MSEGIQSLFLQSVWLNANWMLDTKHVSRFVVDEFQPAIVTVPLWVPTNFECDALLVLEVVFVFEYVSNAEFERTRILVPIERVQVVSDEAV